MNEDKIKCSFFLFEIKEREKTAQDKDGIWMWKEQEIRIRTMLNNMCV